MFLFYTPFRVLAGLGLSTWALKWWYDGSKVALGPVSKLRANLELYGVVLARFGVPDPGLNPPRGPPDKPKKVYTFAFIGI